MQFENLNSPHDNDLLSIEDLKALRLRQKKIASNKKARKYISEINARYTNIRDQKNNYFF